MASFFLDHHILPRLGRLLRDRGHAVMSAQEAHLDRASDREILQFVGAAGLTLVSGDGDFIALHATTTGPHAGILLVPPLPHEPWDLARNVAEALDWLVSSGRPLANELYRFRSAGGWEHWDEEHGWRPL